jgi:hypothetical protein
VSPERVTVKVNGVEPLFPSNCVAVVPAIDNVIESSFKIKPGAAAVVIVAGVLGVLNVTVKPSFGATIVSAFTLIVITCVEEPAAKVTVPLGNAFPEKFDVPAWFAPLPATV